MLMQHRVSPTLFFTLSIFHNSIDITAKVIHLSQLLNGEMMKSFTCERGASSFLYLIFNP
jgi:hypothetical protein